MDAETSDESAALATAFRAVKSKKDVADLLDVKLRRIAFYIHKHPSPYKEFEIKKRSGLPRVISAPVEGLKEIQRRLSRYLYAVYRTRPCVHGYAQGRSIVTNARNYVKKKYILNIDIQDFFGTMHIGRVIGLFEKVFHLNKSVATFLSQICCSSGKLPQGAPTSPILSNLLCWNLDNKLLSLAKNHRCSYTSGLSLTLGTHV